MSGLSLAAILALALAAGLVGSQDAVSLKQAPEALVAGEVMAVAPLR